MEDIYARQRNKTAKILQLHHAGRPGAKGSPAPANKTDGQWLFEGAISIVHKAVFKYGAAFYPTGDAAQSNAFTDTVLHPQRTDADGAA